MLKYSTGKLEIRILEARLVYDTQILGGMNSFCKYKFKDEQPYQTETCKSGGKKPKWDNAYNSVYLRESDKDEHGNTHLDINSQLDIEVYSAGTFGNTLLGTAAIRFSSMVIDAEDSKTDWYSIFNLNDIAGMIQLETKFLPDVSKSIPFILENELNSEQRKQFEMKRPFEEIITL